MGVGLVGKYFLRWERPWWNETPYVLNLGWTPEEAEGRKVPAEWFKGVFGYVSVGDHDNMLVCWISGRCAEVADSIPDDEVTAS